MMDVTDVHFRQLSRLLSKHTRLYTEMVVDSTLIFNEKAIRRSLDFPVEQHPIALQLGGSDPEQLHKAARIALPYGYDEINLNVGCPSPKVAGKGCFGAALMQSPAQVGEAMAAISEAAAGAGEAAPETTVKCRIGVDDRDSYEELCEFVETVHAASPATRTFIIHARKAILSGLSPAQNRSVPPLKHAHVHALARDFPHLRFVLNGGIEGCYQAAAAIDHLPPGGGAIEGAMMGRAPMNDLWGSLADADRAVFGCEENASRSRREALEAYAVYAGQVQGTFGEGARGRGPHPGVRLLMMPALALFHGVPGGKRWRRAVDTVLLRATRGEGGATSVADVLAQTLEQSLAPEVLDAPPGPAPAAAPTLHPSAHALPLPERLSETTAPTAAAVA